MRAMICGMLVALAVPTASHSQERIGTAIIDGKRIALLDNFRWEYEESVTPNCFTIGTGFEFCPPLGRWNKTDNQEAGTTQFRFNDRNYGLFVYEGVGSDDGMTTALMRSIAIENMATMTGQKVEEIPVLESFDVTLLGYPAETIVYVGDLDGMSVVFSNTILTLPEQVLQSATYSINGTYTAEHRAMHQELLDSIKAK